MFSRILVAFDGSDHAKQALRDGVELAQVGDAKLTVLSVSLPIAAWVKEAGLGKPLSVDEVQRQVDDVFWTELDEAGEMIPSDVVSTSTLRVGDAAEEILDQVSEACPVPVLIVHGAKSSPPDEVSLEVPTSPAMSHGN